METSATGPLTNLWRRIEEAVAPIIEQVIEKAEDLADKLQCANNPESEDCQLYPAEYEYTVIEIIKFDNSELEQLMLEELELFNKWKYVIEQPLEIPAPTQMCLFCLPDPDRFTAPIKSSDKPSE